MELNYNIIITLGDYSCDGHCQSQNFHIVSNYSAYSIDEAYSKLVEELNWDFTRECEDYETNELSNEGLNKLLELGILSQEEVNENLNDWRSDHYTIEDCDEYIRIFFELVKEKLSDLEWDYRDLKENNLSALLGAGYGLFY